MAVIERKNPFLLADRVSATRVEDEYDHKRFKQWVADLPIGNVSKIAHALHSETDRLNRREMSPIERFSALELLLPALSYVLERLREYFATKPIPLSGQNRLIARMYLELLVRVVIGYKTVLAQFHDDSFTGYLLHKRTRSDAARRILYFLGQILLHEYSLYRSSPGFVWKELHGIYYYAVQNELHDKQIDVSEDDACDRLSLKDIYKRILLLAVADPNSLPRGEAKKVNEALIQWLPHVTFVAIEEDVMPQPAFLVDATKDAPPCPADICDREKIKLGWIMGTAGLVQILDQKIQAMESNATGHIRPIDAVSIRLIARLRAAWGRSIVSRDERQPESGVIEVTCGLLALYQLFGGEVVAQSLTGKQGAACYTIDGTKPDQNEKPLAHDEFIIDAGEALLSGISTEEEQVQQLEVELNILDSEPSAECTSVNKSTRGYYLVWPGESECKAHVGELLGVNSGENLDVNKTWSLGIVRWAHVRNNGLMGYGIELLPGNIEPVKLERWYDNDSKTDVMLGFQQLVAGRVESIITYPFYTGDSDRFVLVQGAERIVIVPDRILECTVAIMRFTIKTDSTEITAAERDSKQHSLADERFNAIWDDLDI